MRHFCFGMIWIMGWGSVAAQPAETDSVYMIVDKMPEYPGGNEEMLRYLMKNIHIPGGAREEAAQGKVVVYFIVNKNGELSDVHVKKAYASKVDQSVITVVQKMPRWNLGIRNGKVVNCHYTLPIRCLKLNK